MRTHKKTLTLAFPDLTDPIDILLLPFTMSILLSYSSIIRSSLPHLHRLTRHLPPLSLTFFFSQLSSAIPPPEYDNDDDDALNPISEFLLKECGLSPSQLTRVMGIKRELSRVRSSETARGAVEALRDSGFTPKQVIQTILRWPTILTLKEDGQMKLKIDFLKTLGLTGQHLANAIYKGPALLGSSLENNLVPRIPHLEKLFGSNANVCKAIRRTPSLLYCNVDKLVNHNLDVLKHYGVQGESLSNLISITPDVLTRFSQETLKLRLEYLKNRGIFEGSKISIYAILTVVHNRPETIEKKLKKLANLGLRENEIRQLLMKQPHVLNVSMNKLQENMDFLIHVARFLPNIVVKYPVLFNFSIEKRLKPRHNVFKALCSMQQTQQLPSLVYIFHMSEKNFLKFMEGGPYSSILNDIYKGKGNAADVRNI